MGLFDKINDMVGDATDAVADAVAGEAPATTPPTAPAGPGDGGGQGEGGGAATGWLGGVFAAVGDAVHDAAEAAVDAAESVPAPPTEVAFDAGLGAGSPVINVGPPDIMAGSPEWQPTSSASVRVGPVEFGVDTAVARPGDATAFGGTVLYGHSVTVGIDAPGADASFTGEQVFATNPGVVGIVPRVGGPGFGASGGVELHPEEIDLGGNDAAGFVDTTITPSPAGPIPIPYPNMDAALPSMPSAEFDPVTVTFGDDLGEGSHIPTAVVPDAFAVDPQYIETPDLEFDLGDVSTSVSVDPMLPTPTVHGGFSVAGADVDAELDSPWVDVEADVQVAATVDPMVSPTAPYVGGMAGGGEVTVDLDAPDDYSPASTTDEFESSLQSIDDAAGDLDIFD